MNRNLAGLFAPAAAILLVAVVVVVVAGAWPPFVAVESGSMAPSVERGDLVVVTSIERFPWGGLVSNAETGAPTRLGDRGDVVVFSAPDSDGNPILHRLAFPVAEGEDWTERADPGLLTGDCAALESCPAPHDGYVTYGDANGQYDQSAGVAPVVREEWITAKALFAVSSLGWFRVGIDAAIAGIGLIPTVIGLVGVTSLVGGVGALLIDRLGRISRRRSRPRE